MPTSMAAPVPMPVVLQGLLPEPGLSGPMREVLLTPGTEGDELGRGGRRRKMRQRIKKRMKRRQQRDEPDDEEDAATEGDELGRRGGRRRRRFVRADDESDDLE